MPVEAVPVWLASWLRGDAAVTPSLTGDAADEPEMAIGDGEAASLSLVPQSAQAAVRLPPRQLEVMQLLSEGCSVKEIAQRLDIGVGLVKVNLSQAYAALGARNRIEAVARAQGLFEARTGTQG